MADKSLLERNKKELPLSGAAAVGPFVVSLLALPVVLFVFVPLTVIYQVIRIPFKGKKKVSRDTRLEAPAKVKPTEERDFDLVLFGATGFTGKMAAKYLAKNYGNSKLRWGIAGRRRDVLEEVRNSLVQINGNLKDLPILIADSSNPETLRQVVDNTKVVITTVGPFAKYGTPLVELCAQHGTHYCDITGETDWVRKTIHLFHEQARQSGARIVHFCGHDCVPWDLAVLKIAEHLKRQGENLSVVRCFDSLRGSASGGTLATVFHSLEDRTRDPFPFDPLLTDTQGRSDAKLIFKNQLCLSYSSIVKKWVGPFVMAAVMANCVRRSNAVNRYNRKLTYWEGAVYPSFMAGFATVVGYLFFGVSLFFPPLKYVLRKFLPKPGEGPSEADMDRGFLDLTAVGEGDKGSVVRANMYFPTDPGYRDTARMLVESGLSLALPEDFQQIAERCPGGVWTPAICQGSVLLKRLEATGTEFSIN